MSDNRKAFYTWLETTCFIENGLGFHNELYSAWQASTEQSSKEIERLNALVAMQAEALKAVNNADIRWNHDVHIEKQVDLAISASSSTVAKWEAEKLLPPQRQVAMLSDIVALSLHCKTHDQQRDYNTIARNALSITQATAEAYEREHAAKVLEEVAEKFSSVEGYTKNIRVEISGWLELQAAELRAANKKENG